MFRFASPYFFLLLVIIPAALWYRRRNRMQPSMGVSSLHGVGQLRRSMALRFGWLPLFLKYGALVLLIAAMARPQWGTRQVSVKTEGINIVLAVDISESMAALDFRLKGKIINRLEAVKDVIRQFIAKRDGDRIGMVVFGSEAYTQVPLTRDYTTIASILDRVRIGAAGPSTSIGDAIGISLKRLEDISSKSSVIILLTDGRSNSGELTPEVAAEIAKEKAVKVYTIGVGGKGRVPFLIRQPPFGERYVYRQVDIDEETLQDIADKTGGLYFKAEDTKRLADVYDTIDRLEKTEVEVKTYAEYRELYSYLLVPALILIGAWTVLINTRFLRIP